jgi:hypothetical protein
MPLAGRSRVGESRCHIGYIGHFSLIGTYLRLRAVLTCGGAGQATLLAAQTGVPCLPRIARGQPAGVRGSLPFLPSAENVSRHVNPNLVRDGCSGDSFRMAAEPRRVLIGVRLGRVAGPSQAWPNPTDRGPLNSTRYRGTGYPAKSWRGCGPERCCWAVANTIARAADLNPILR